MARAISYRLGRALRANALTGDFKMILVRDSAWRNS